MDERIEQSAPPDDETATTEPVDESHDEQPGDPDDQPPTNYVPV